MKNHLLDESARGVFVIAATPFADDGSLDLDSLARLIDFYVGAGVHGLTILGMMGEAPKLTYEESCLVVERKLRQVAGKLPVVVGVSNPGLANVALLTSVAMSTVHCRLPRLATSFQPGSSPPLPRIRCACARASRISDSGY